MRRIPRDRVIPLPGYHRSMLIVRITLLAAVWVVGGCSVASSSGDGRGSLTPSSIQPTQVPDSGSPGASGRIDLPASVIDPVVAEIAKLANVPVDRVAVISAEAVTFPNGGLGCPIPGMAYTQVQVDGYRIVAQASGVTYDYRGTGSTFRRCENPKP